jgi:hypothetical protein
MKVDAYDLMIMTVLLILGMVLTVTIPTCVTARRLGLLIKEGNQIQRETNELLWEQLEMMLMYEEPIEELLAEPAYLTVQRGLDRACAIYKHPEVRKLCKDLDLHKNEFAKMSSYWYGHMRGEAGELRGRQQ